MTAYQYMDIAQSNYATSFTILSLLLVLASGYFVAAYVMGKHLSRSQVALLNLVYGAWSLGLAWIGSRFLIAATDAALLAAALTPDSVPKTLEYAYLAPSIMTVTSLLLSYGFMWSIRHPKEE
jgi:hypothetical protein